MTVPRATSFAAGSWSELGWPDPAPGDVYAISRVRQASAVLAELAGNAADTLSSIAGAGSAWEGEAADAFHSRLGDLRPHLDHVTSSFDAAAQTFSRYAAALPELQERAALLLPRALEADRRRRAADPFSNQLFTINGNPAAQQAVADLHAIRREYEQIVEDHAAAVRSCLAGLDEAARLGMRNDGWSWVRRHLHDVAEGVSTVMSAVSLGAFLLTLAQPELAPVTGLIMLGAGAVGVVAGAIAVSTDIAYGGPIAKDAAELGLDAVFFGASGMAKLSERAAVKEGDVAEQSALKSSLQAATADREFEQAVAARKAAEADRILDRKVVLDVRTQEALARAQSAYANAQAAATADKVVDSAGAVNDSRKLGEAAAKQGGEQR